MLARGSNALSFFLTCWTRFSMVFLNPCHVLRCVKYCEMRIISARSENGPNNGPIRRSMGKLRGKKWANMQGRTLCQNVPDKAFIILGFSTLSLVDVGFNLGSSWWHWLLGRRHRTRVVVF